MIDLQDITKVYQIGDEKVYALNHVTMHIYPREFVSVIGPSGSGKSTLMNIIVCLDTANAGTYRLDGIPIEDYSEKQHRRNQKDDNADNIRCRSMFHIAYLPQKEVASPKKGHPN